MEGKNNRWTLKNVITLAVFTVIIFIVLMLVTMVTNVLITPVGAYFAGPGIAALLAGPFFMVMVSKIEKRGAVFLLSLITGLLFLVMGQLYTFLVYLVLGLVAELFFPGKGSYQRPVHNMGADVNLCNRTPMARHSANGLPYSRMREDNPAPVGQRTDSRLFSRQNHRKN